MRLDGRPRQEQACGRCDATAAAEENSQGSRNEGNQSSKQTNTTKYNHAKHTRRERESIQNKPLAKLIQNGSIVLGSILVGIHCQPSDAAAAGGAALLSIEQYPSERHKKTRQALLVDCGKKIERSPGHRMRNRSVRLTAKRVGENVEGKLKQTACN